MFVKETTVRRGSRSYTYLQMVEGYRDEAGRVRHRVVAKLGRKDALKSSGQLEALAGSFARLDPPMTGVRREVGALLLAAHFLGELDVAGTIDRALPRSARSIVPATSSSPRKCAANNSAPTSRRTPVIGGSSRANDPASASSCPDDFNASFRPKFATTR